MKPYFHNGEDARQASNDTLHEYPNHQQTLTQYTNLPNEAVCLVEGKPFPTNIDAPSPLIVRALDNLKMVDRSATRVLDIGCGTASQGLFLAANGFLVTGIDTDKHALDIAHQTARSLGLSERNFAVKAGSALELPSTEKYNVIIAGMLLHLFKKEDNRNIVRQMKALTLPAGMNLLSAYTTDNPEEESAHGRPYLFEPRELQKLYSDDGWQSISNVVRLNERPQARSGTKFIVPTIVEFISKKSGPIKKLGQTALGQDLEYWRRADPEYYYHLCDMQGL